MLGIGDDPVHCVSNVFRRTWKGYVRNKTVVGNDGDESMANKEGSDVGVGETRSIG